MKTRLAWWKRTAHQPWGASIMCPSSCGNAWHLYFLTQIIFVRTLKKKKNQKVVRVWSPWPSPLQRLLLYHRGLAFLPSCNEYHIMAKHKLINKNKKNNTALLGFRGGRGRSEFIAHQPTFYCFILVQPLWLRRGDCGTINNRLCTHGFPTRSHYTISCRFANATTEL